MSNPTDAIKAAVHSAFVSYSQEGDPDWRSASWITPEECTHLVETIMRELENEGYQIVKKES